MTQLAYSSDYPAPPPSQIISGADRLPVKSPAIAFLFLIPALLAATAWTTNLPMLTDVAFSIMALSCFLIFCYEILNFRERFAIGTMVISGGVLVWFTQDYYTHWFNADWKSIEGVEPWVIAKETTYICLFIVCSLFTITSSKGIYNLHTGERGIFMKLLQRPPEPADNGRFGMLLAIMFLIGFCPFVLFTAEHWWIAIPDQMFGLRAGSAEWTIGRTGNLNYSWGGYIPQLMQVGQVGAVLAFIFAWTRSQSWISFIVCHLVWAFWLLMGFGSGARGEVVFVGGPAAALIFIKYQRNAALYLKRFTKRAYVYAMLVLFFMLVLVQFQGEFRDETFDLSNISKIDLAKNQGNTMFSEAIYGYRDFPDKFPFSRSEYVGEGAFRILPDTAIKFAISWIPRPLWPDKPSFDDDDLAYSALVSGDSRGAGGTTIAASIVGVSYRKYGSAGVIEIGLLFGWLCALAERGLQLSGGKAIKMLASLGLATYLFRAFRDLNPHDLYGLVIGLGVLSIIIYFLNAGRTFQEEPLPATQPAV